MSKLCAMQKSQVIMVEEESLITVLGLSEMNDPSVSETMSQKVKVAGF